MQALAIAAATIFVFIEPAISSTSRATAIARVLEAIVLLGILVPGRIQHVPAALKRLSPMLLLAIWLMVRSIASGVTLNAASTDWLRAAIMGVGAYSLVRSGRGRSLQWSLGAVGVVFALSSQIFGSLTASKTRYAGLSGNPNDLALAVTALAPFVFSLQQTRTRRSMARTLGIVYVILSAILILRALSIEGGVLLLLALALAFQPTWRKYRGHVGMRLVALAVALIGGTILAALLFGALTNSGRLNQASITSLSGRTSTIGNALSHFWASPLIGVGGNGEFSITNQGLEGIFSGRNVTGLTSINAHDTYASVLGQGGCIAALLLVVVIVFARRWFRLLRDIPAGRTLRNAAVLLAVESLVGDIQQLVLTWVVLAAIAALADRRLAALNGERVSQSVNSRWLQTPAYPRVRGHQFQLQGRPHTDSDLDQRS